MRVLFGDLLTFYTCFKVYDSEWVNREFVATLKELIAKEKQSGGLLAAHNTSHCVETLVPGLMAPGRSSPEEH